MTIVKAHEDGSKEIDTETCEYCKGDSNCLKPGVPQVRDKLVYMTSQEWCADTGVCAATIDWEKIYGRE